MNKYLINIREGRKIKFKVTCLLINKTLIIDEWIQDEKAPSFVNQF